MLPEQFDFFAKYIEREVGIVYGEHNSFQLESRVQQIAKSMLLPSVDALYEKARIGIDGMLKQMLLDVATNNETSFFRDPKVFVAIENVVLPEAAKAAAAAKDKLRLWSAASSFGQEPVTLSMIYQEMLGRQPMPELEIVASDLSERALDRARSGKYTQLEVQRGLPFPLLLKYFTKDADDYWRCSATLLSRIRYCQHNLKNPFPMRNAFHLVLCRNVLIYQRPEAKTEIVASIAQNLLPRGFLIMGAGESLIGVSTEFETVMSGEVVLYRKKK